MANRLVHNKYILILLGALVLSALYLTSLHSYLLFHAIAEVFSVIIGCGIFMIAWNSRRFSDNHYLFLIGIAYLFVAIIDFVHILGYKGMGVFPGYGSNLATQLWIAARYLESVTLLLAPIYINRKLNPNRAFIGYTITTSLLLLSIFYWQIFPTGYIEGIGLTPFKKISEYIISLILLASAYLLWQKRQAFDARVLRLLGASIIATIASELCFTLYVDVYGLLNLLGHLFKVVSFYLIYKATIETALDNPYNLLFLELRRARDELEIRVQERTAELAETNLSLQSEIAEHKRAAQALRESEQRSQATLQTTHEGFWRVNLQGKITQVNNAYCAMSGYTQDELLQMSISDIEVIEDETQVAAHIETILRDGADRFETRQRRKDGSIYDIEVSAAFMDLDGGQIIGFLRDITERKRAEEDLRESEKRYRLISENAGDVIWVMNPTTGQFTYVSPSVEKLRGYTPSEVMAQPVTASLTPESLKLVNESLAITLPAFIAKGTGTESFVHEVDQPRKDGSIVHTEVTTTYVLNERGEVEIVGVSRDITERKHAEEKIKQQINQLSALREIDAAISSSFDLHVTLEILLQKVTTQLHADAADVLLLNPHTQTLEYYAGRGFRATARQHTHLRLGESPAGRAALEHRLIQIPNLTQDSQTPASTAYLSAEAFISYVAVPLATKGYIKGVLEVFHRTPHQPDLEWLNFLETLAGQAAIAIDNAELFQNVQRSNLELALAYDATIEGWSRALDLRDEETEGHSTRVTEMTLRLAQTFGFKDADLVHIRRGALLHDIGKMGIPDRILLKPGALTEEEWTIMRKHPEYAHQLLSSIAHLRPALDIPYCHHEKWGGTGYPRRLKGEQIPLAARIFAIVDVWDAVTSDRPYRAAWSAEEARTYIREQSGKHFDPQVVRAFFSDVRTS